MNGQLSEHPLAELVQEISGASLSGALRLARERAKGAVYFDGGQVAAALSNLRAFRLLEALRRGGLVDPAKLYTVVGESASDEQAAAALLRAGLLDEAALGRLQARQSQEVMRELLRWTEGEWSFDPRVRLSGAQQGARVEIAWLLVEAARALPPGFAAARVGEDELIAPAEGVQEKAAAAPNLLPTEAFVLTRVYTPLRLREVVALGGLPEEETRRAVYALALAGLLERPERPRAFSAEDLRRASARPAAKEAPAQEAAPQTGEREQPAEPSALGTVDELFKRAQGETHYEVLGVARTAPTEEVKRAYYAHARRLHPDRFRRDADDEQRQRIDNAFAKIAQAYDVLKDAALRAAYDLKLSKKK